LIINNIINIIIYFYSIVSFLPFSIAAYITGILAYYKCRTSTAKVEGINNKIKVLKRNAYGYRDIDYFKLRLFNLHNDEITRFVG